MSSAPTKDAAAFLQEAKQALGRVLARLANATATPQDADGAALTSAQSPGESILRVAFAGSGSLKGYVQWSCEKTAAVQCAQLLMSQPADAAAEYDATKADAFLEFLRQVAGELAVSWKKRAGYETELVWQAEPVAGFSGNQSATVEITSEKVQGLIFRLELNAEFCVALQSASQAVAEAPGEAASEAAAEVEPAEPPHGGLPSNLSLILDVQLDATIRFGERKMLLQDVFALMPGAIVELNQLVNEPADLLVAGRLVARGEVVVVDGNFGLRVKEVVTKNQRAAVLDLE